MGGPTGGSPGSMANGMSNGTDLNPRLPHNNLTVLKPPQSVSGTNRRDSGNSTIRSFYGSSLRSDGGQNSRRSSAMSQVSAALQGISPSTVNGRAVTNASPYDPISPGSSRRSSGVEQPHGNVPDNQPNSLASSSNTLTSSIQAHFQRIHRRALGLSGDYEIDHPTDTSTSTLAPQSNGMRNDNSSAFATFISSGRPMGNSQEIRRMSDPCSSGSRQHGVMNGMGNHVNHHAFLQRHQNHNFGQNNAASNGGGGVVNGPPAGHQQSNASNNVNGSFGDEFIIPDDMATYLSEVQSGGNTGVTNNTMNTMRQGCDPERPSTCPPASLNQLPPPPPYNQAVAGHHNNSIGQNNNGRQNHHTAQPNTAAYAGGNAPSGYGAMSVGSPATYASSANGSAAVPSPYAQVNSPAYSHASVMSPKNPSVPMHSPMSISCASPASAIPPSPQSRVPNNSRTNAANVMQPSAGTEASGMMGPVNAGSSYCPPQNPQQNSHSQVPTQQPQNYPYHNNQQYQGYSNSSTTSYSSSNYGSSVNYPQNGNMQNQYNQQQQQTTGFYNANSSHYSTQYNGGNYNATTATPQNYGYNGNSNHQHYNCQCPPQQQGSSSRVSHHQHHQQMYWQQNQSQHQHQSQSSNAAYSQTHSNQTHAGTYNNVAWNAGSAQNMTGTNGHYHNNWNSQCYQNSSNVSNPTDFNKCSQSQTGPDVKPFRRNQIGNVEIQCQSVTSQSQSSQRMATVGPCHAAPRANAASHNMTSNNSNRHGPSNNPPVGMRPDTYQRTLEYVQQCQLWSSTEHKLISNGSGVPSAAPGSMHNNNNNRDSCNPLSPDSTTDGKHKLSNHNGKPSV